MGGLLRAVVKCKAEAKLMACPTAIGRQMDDLPEDDI